MEAVVFSLARPWTEEHAHSAAAGVKLSRSLRLGFCSFHPSILPLEQCAAACICPLYSRPRSAETLSERNKRILRSLLDGCTVASADSRGFETSTGAASHQNSRLLWLRTRTRSRGPNTHLLHHERVQSLASPAQSCMRAQMSKVVDAMHVSRSRTRLIGWRKGTCKNRQERGMQ